MLSAAGSIVFLIDVDNTLLDNDQFSADLDDRLRNDFGESERVRYRGIYGDLRDQKGFADYLGALQDFRRDVDALDEEKLLEMSAFLLDYPFVERVYPKVRDVIEHLGSIGTTAILSDGDIVFQPRKIHRSGLWDLVQGRVMVTLHKERRMGDVQRRFPADHYVIVDDKPHLLTATKDQLGAKSTTVFVRQGHYAHEADGTAVSGLDISIDSIAELTGFGRGRFLSSDASARADPAIISMEAT